MVERKARLTAGEGVEECNRGVEGKRATTRRLSGWLCVVSVHNDALADYGRDAASLSLSLRNILEAESIAERRPCAL